MATTNISNLLLGELQNLCTEARRKHPDIKEAAERVIVVLRGIKTTGIEEIASELSKSDEVIRPFVLACRSNNQRLTSIAMHCLQQLVSRQAISPGSIRETLTTLSFVSAQGVVDVQVKVLQMVLPLVTIYGDSVCGETLVEAFALCLALQRSRDPIVSNTAAAILRQVVVAVFDRVVAEDRELGVSEGDQDLTRKSAKDAYYVLQDLCLLASDIEPIFIRIDHAVDKRLVLELIESVLTNHAGVVSQHAAMAQTLRERLAPFIVGFFAERASFALAVRSIRIAWLFVRDLHTHLPAECEIILSVFSRLVDSGAAAAAPNGSGNKRRASLSTKTAVGSAGFPLFYRVLALEVVRDLLENAPLLHKLYSLYDGRVADEDAGKEEDCHVILDLVSAISRVAVERGDLRSAHGSIPSAPPDHTLAVGDAASTDVLAQQIGASTCRMRLEMYKLLDKQDPPNIPDTYMFYLAAAAVISFSEGLVGDILPRCTERISCQPLHSGSRQQPLTEASVLGAVKELGVVGGFVRHAWAAVFSAYEFMAGVRFDDHLFGRMLESAQKLAETAGALGMNEARDTMLALLCSGCLPAASSGEMMVPNSRQVQCLRAVIGCTLYLASALGPAWYMVLATVQQMEESLYLSRGKHSASTPIIGSDDSVASSELKTVRDEFARLLAFVRAHNGDAILWLIRGLRVLGSDLSGIAVQLDEAEEMRRLRALALGSAPAVIQQQRGSTFDRPTFAIEELRGFAVSNVDLLMGAAASDVGEQAWAAIIDDLLATATGSEAAAGLRTQACEALADVVLAAMALVTQADTQPASFQALVESGSAQVRILQPLSLMMARGEHAGVRRLTLDTLHRVLQASGHSITRAWGVVFDIVESTAEGRHSSLMRSVFPCLQLICTDYLADLPPTCLRRCIKALLVQFGRQEEDLNIALTAVGQAWALCDYFHAMPCADEPHGSGDLISAQLEALGEEMVFAALWQEELIAGTRRAQQVLWLLLLQALAQLGRDARAEVRLGGMQTLFRAVDMHGPSSFDRWVWDGAVWAVIHPLAQYALTQRTRVFDTLHETPPPPEPSSTASGMVAEDPQRLLRKQWDDTVAAALLGAAKAWAYDGVWLIGGADRAWARVWLMTAELLAGEWRLRSRDAVAGALAAMRALVALAGGSSGAWRTAWDAWVAMARGATQLPTQAAAEINIDDDNDDPVVTQDVLCALLEPSPALIAGLGPGFDAQDCDALLGVVCHAVAFVDAPIYASDFAAMTRLQGLALDVVAGALENASDAVAASVVGELAVLAALSHALRQKRGESVALGDAAVVGASGLAYLDGHIERLDVLEGHKKEGTHRRRYAHPVPPTFAALGRAAGGRLGAALCDRAGLAQRVLESGAWLSAVAALGLDLIHSDDPWFVRTVPPAMNTLPPGGLDLDASWMAIGSVVSLALRTKEVRSREALLDAISDCSVKMASSCPREYWDVLLNTIEASSVEDNDDNVLAVASLGWLERLSSIECPLVPEWVAASAAQRLVRRTKTIVDTFVADRTLFGSKSPLPLQRTHLLRRVLQGLALLQTRPMEGKGEGRASHIVAVFPCLIGLVAESMSDFETARALQMCLRRVANEVLLISG